MLEPGSSPFIASSAQVTAAAATSASTASQRAQYTLVAFPVEPLRSCAISGGISALLLFVTKVHTRVSDDQSDNA